jgi:hypothetical protein
VASLVEEKVLGQLQASMGNRLTRMQAFYIDIVFMAGRAVDARAFVDTLDKLGCLYGLIYSFRPSHPHKIYFAEKRSKGMLEWKEEFPGWEVTGFAELSDGQGRVPPSAMGQGIKLAGVRLGSLQHYGMLIWEKAVKQLAKVSTLSEHVSPRLWCW